MRRPRKINTPSYFHVIAAQQTIRWWPKMMRSSSRLGMTWEMDSLLRIPAGKVTFIQARMGYSKDCSSTMNMGVSPRCMIAATVDFHRCSDIQSPVWMTERRCHGLFPHGDLHSLCSGPSHISQWPDSYPKNFPHCHSIPFVKCIPSIPSLEVEEPTSTQPRPS